MLYTKKRIILNILFLSQIVKFSSIDLKIKKYSNRYNVNAFIVVA